MKRFLKAMLVTVVGIGLFIIGWWSGWNAAKAKEEDYDDGDYDFDDFDDFDRD